MSLTDANPLHAAMQSDGQCNAMRAHIAVQWFYKYLRPVP